MTDYLFAKPSFMGGMARALDLGDTLTLYNESLAPAMADFLAIKSDWEAVGKDLSSAMQEFAAQHGRQNE